MRWIIPAIDSNKKQETFKSTKASITSQTKPDTKDTGLALVCDQSTLRDALSFVAFAIPANPTHPVINNVLLVGDLRQQQLSLSSYNLEFGMTVSIEANIASSGQISLPHKLFSKIVDKFLPGEISLTSTLPAGFGKTTLLAEWVAAIPTRPIAWVSLDQSDNDPAFFWNYLITALQKIQPSLGERSRSLLQSPQPPSIESVLMTLLNEFAAVEADLIEQVWPTMRKRQQEATVLSWMKVLPDPL